MKEDMKLRRASELFPMIGGDEFESLKRDIAEHGQREPIIYVDGKLIDGRNRLRACKELGIEPKIREISAEEAGDTFALVMSLNFHRRHLNSHNKGEAMAAYVEHVGARTGKTGRSKKSESHSDIPRTLPQVAAKLGITERTARNYLKAAEDYAAAAPELQAKVDAGEITPKQVRIETEKKEGKEPKEPKEPREPRRQERTETELLDDCIDEIENVIRDFIQRCPAIRKPLCGQLRAIEQRLNK